jgi:hypothetical protein
MIDKEKEGHQLKVITALVAEGLYFKVFVLVRDKGHASTLLEQIVTRFGRYISVKKLSHSTVPFLIEGRVYHEGRMNSGSPFIIEFANANLWSKKLSHRQEEYDLMWIPLDSVPNNILWDLRSKLKRGPSPSFFYGGVQVRENPQ